MNCSHYYYPIITLPLSVSITTKLPSILYTQYTNYILLVYKYIRLHIIFIRLIDFN